MRRAAFFLIPTTYSRDGKLPIDYQFVEREVDRRTRFWKVNKNRETSSFCTVVEAERHGLRIFRDEDGALCRILAQDGKASKSFYDRMTSLGWKDGNNG